MQSNDIKIYSTTSSRALQMPSNLQKRASRDRATELFPGSSMIVSPIARRSATSSKCHQDEHGINSDTKTNIRGA
eukprot:6008707-Amphidinium_carterae.3